MPWQEYWRDQVDAIDKTERETESAWKEALVGLLIWERWLRRRTVRAAFDLPVVRGGWLDTSDRAAFRRFRSNVRRDSEFANRGLRRRLGLGSGRDEVRRITQSRSLPLGPIRNHLDRVGRRVPLAIALRGDRGRGVGIRVPGVAGDIYVPNDLTPGELQQIEQDIANLPDSGGFLEDRWELGYDSMLNIARNLGYDLRRVTESVVRLTGRMNRREDIQAFMDGGPRGRSWQFNRNNMRLSVTSHMRGMHRRRSIASGIDAGVTHYRLDIPKSRRGDVGQGGHLSRQLWRVRTLGEWQTVHRGLNAGRISASGFDTLGMHHGDFSYVVPVPQLYFADAIRHGNKLRARHAAKGLSA